MKEGILLIDKSAGLTSRKVDNYLQHLFKTKKAGHLGTLDPFATGLLICGIGQGTKFFPFLPDEEKEYEATLKLNIQTNTGDLTGNRIKEENLSFPKKEELEEAAKKMLLLKEQIPPMTSAIKKDGVPLYRYFQKGEEKERKARPIRVFSFKIVSYDEKECTITFQTKVSKGTYIRVLGETFASYLSRIGHLLSLRRIAIGNISLKYAQKLDEINDFSFVEVEKILPFYHVDIQDSSLLFLVENGRKIHSSYPSDKIYFTYQNRPLALYKEEEKGMYVCLRGFRL